MAKDENDEKDGEMKTMKTNEKTNEKRMKMIFKVPRYLQQYLTPTSLCSLLTAPCVARRVLGETAKGTIRCWD
jgi:hypothetical protein